MSTDVNLNGQPNGRTRVARTVAAAEAAVTAASNAVQERSKGISKLFVALLIVLPLVMIVMDGFVVVQPGQQGVVIRMGELTGDTFAEGLHLKAPLVETVDRLDMQIQKFSADDMQASSMDLQNVTTSVAVNYRLNPDKVIDVRRQLGAHSSVHESRALQPQLHEAIKAVTARYNAQDLIAKRREVSNAMRDTFQKKLDNLIDDAFMVDEFAITNFTFSGTFNRAIEAKVEAAERALQAENEVRQAKAEAEKQIATAEGRAQSVRIGARAEADAIRLRAQAFREFPEVLKMDTIERWDGKLPLVLGGDSQDLLLNVSDFAAAQQRAKPRPAAHK